MSTVSSRRIPRPVAIAAVFLIAAIFGCALAVYLDVRSQLQEATDYLAEDRARAERTVEQRAYGYAEAVAKEDPDVSDSRLDELALQLEVTLQGIERDSNQSGYLVVIVEAVEPYRGWWARAGYVLTCYRVRFAGLGTPDAAYELAALPSCPTARRTPAATAGSLAENH